MFSIDMICPTSPTVPRQILADLHKKEFRLKLRVSRTGQLSGTPLNADMTTETFVHNLLSQCSNLRAASLVDGRIETVLGVLHEQTSSWGDGGSFQYIKDYRSNFDNPSWTLILSETTNHRSLRNGSIQGIEDVRLWVRRICPGLATARRYPQIKGVLAVEPPGGLEAHLDDTGFQMNSDLNLSLMVR
jgi:hypothetical protein